MEDRFRSSKFHKDTAKRIKTNKQRNNKNKNKCSRTEN